MSLMPATTKGEGQWQHCNYGYDSSKYNSRAECMADIDQSTKDELTDYGKFIQQTSDEALKDASLRSCEDILKAGLPEPYRTDKYNKCLENKQESHTSNFSNENSDTIRVVVIIVVALYVWKSGMLNKLLK